MSDSGKSHLLSQLKELLDPRQFLFYDGSSVIERHLPGGLAEFKQLDDELKYLVRETAIRRIQYDCIANEKTAIVAGHLMLWDDDETQGREGSEAVDTKADWQAYTHIVYLDVPPQTIAHRRRKDNLTKTRKRPECSVGFLHKWQEAEKLRLRVQCRQHGVLFTRVTPRENLLGQVARLLRDFSNHSETYNLRCAQDRLDTIIAEHPDQRELTQVIVRDGDRTVTEVDTGNLFWEEVLPAEERPETDGFDETPLKSIFSSSGYSYTAFRQVALLYEGIAGGAS